MTREETLRLLINNTFNFQNQFENIEILKSNLKAYLPKKLYKYKEVKEYNLKQIQEQYAWFSCISSVDD